MTNDEWWDLCPIGYEDAIKHHKLAGISVGVKAQSTERRVIRQVALSLVTLANRGDYIPFRDELVRWYEQKPLPESPRGQSGTSGLNSSCEDEGWTI
jgi:hypothetical protein